MVRLMQVVAFLLDHVNTPYRLLSYSRNDNDPKSWKRDLQIVIMLELKQITFTVYSLQNIGQAEDYNAMYTFIFRDYVTRPQEDWILYILFLI